ncbi:GH32 C-terminal domain-containing protein [Oerskovia sp. NPDC060338]|uniref:GH32 C-terminal domain-containing protein n=1 Tax=Oerskovia sp. NPDC060338 TaxID=3347100 RepID=UPI003669EE9E
MIDTEPSQGPARPPGAQVRKKRKRSAPIAAVLAMVVTLVAGQVVPAGAADDVVTGQEDYRPGYHFSPAENWMNDPNGLVYVVGTYHLYFQHNPSGNGWGNMSWGHATSPDLVTWTEQPLAIGQTMNEDGVSVEDIFSGSVVVDHNNTSGFGTSAKPPLVALYTSAYTQAHPTLAGKQAQSLAYSTDGGYTWTKYAQNPVLDRDSQNFRDPKVFWYDGGTPQTSYWVMIAVEATDHQAVLYRSDDLRSWDYLSTFGPANSVGGIWECPDLFELPIDGNPDNTRWVLVMNLNPGAIGGGSGGQYFVGDFDGVTFTSESIVASSEPPQGQVVGAFDGSWDGWTVRNEPGNELSGPFGITPPTGQVEGQSVVTGFDGTGLVNSFVGGDWPVGSVESPPFVIDREYLGFLVGGGKHPHVPGGQLGNEPPSGALLWQGFEVAEASTLADLGWTGTGDLAATRSPSTSGGDYVIGGKRLNTWEGGPKGDDNVGTLTSPAFEIDADHLSMLVGGGQRSDADSQVLQVQLLVEGEVVRHLTGPAAGALNWRSWDVSDLRGKQAQLRIVDEATGGWGHLTLDHVVLGNQAATPRSDETTVNLVVDGEVVRTATGNDSEHLDWTSWDVADLVGREATLRVVDNNRLSWGHILADRFTLTDEPVTPTAEQYGWLDWGRDYYATVSFDNVPDGRRYMVGWMNNWNYAGAVPTTPWRSAMALPREVALTDTEDGIVLTQRPVDQLDTLNGEAITVPPGAITEATHPLDVQGDMLRLDVVIDPGTAVRSGLVVRASDGFTVAGGAGAGGGRDSEGTVVGYDARSKRVFVDRTRSGAVDFHDDFASVSSMPVSRDEDGTVHMQLYVDRASVEVFTSRGTRTITDQIFPDRSSLGVSLFAEGGEAELRSMTVTPIRQSVHLVNPVDLDIKAQAQCISGRVAISVTARNTTAEPLEVRLATPFGSRTAVVAPQKLVHQSFATRKAAVTAGAATVVGTLQREPGAGTGPAPRTWTVPYEALDCVT